jgi:hypothetical protein
MMNDIDKVTLFHNKFRDSRSCYLQ